MPTYLTRRGAKQIVDELNQLLQKERPKVVREVAEAAAQGDRSENAEYIYGKKRLREIDRRVHYLQKRLDTAEVVDEARDTDKVFFGAVVEVEQEDGSQRRYQLVGPDEANPAEGRISFQAPLGRALMGRAVGDVVTVRRPAGDVELEILSVRYEPSGEV